MSSGTIITLEIAVVTIVVVGWGLCVLLAAIQAWYNQAGEARRRADPILAPPTLASSTRADRTAP